MGSLNDFNRVAPFYDRLKRWVFGDAVRRSEREGLDEIFPSAKVLIVGGGTGEILEALHEIRPDAHVWYVDASSEMIQRARTRNIDQMICFVHGTDDDLPEGLTFDVIITPFFLDLFDADRLLRIISGLLPRLHPYGLWFVADFVDTGKVWHRVLLSAMYRFFRSVARVEARTLPDWQGLLRETGMREVRSRSFYGGFIRSVVYCRQPFTA